MLRFCNRLLRFACSKQSQQQLPPYQISHSEKLRLLETVSQKVKLGLKPSILISSEESVKKRLSFEQKMQLGLYIPKSPFNPRLSRHTQQKYLPLITSELYQHQQQNLKTFVRIMQNNLYLHSSEPTLDHYINVIYKDIYARYLLSKNVGIQWEGFYANTGVLNVKSTMQYDHITKSQQNYSILLDFIQNNAHLIQQDETIGLFSYYQQRYINPSQVGVEKIKRMGQYIKEQINSFGKYQHQFVTLQQNNSKVYLLLMVQRLEKLIKPNAICVHPEDRFMMLKRYQTEGEINIEYLIVSHHTYKQHQKYFKDNKYEKHNTFDGKYLLGMKCFNVPIVSEISGYQRPPNAYVINSNCHISDFQRVSQHNLPHFAPFIDQFGEIQFDKSNNHVMLQNKYMKEAERKENSTKNYAESYVLVDQELSFHMIDSLKLTKSLQKIFTEEGVQFADFYDVIDDELYFCEKTKEILHFRIGHKYVIDIAEENFQAIIKGLQKQQIVIAESKIKIESINVGKRPRDKRRFRKEKKMKLSQVTDHYTLEESLADLTSITVSSLSQSQFTIPLFLKNSKIVRYESILDCESIEALMKGQLKAINYQKIKEQGYDVKEVYANQQLIKALAYLRNLHKSKEIRNVIIEPQNETEALIPHAIHLNYLISKSKPRGRKFSSEVKNSIALIKLHPTINEDFKDIKVKDLIEGIIKSNEKKQYGLGLQALRLWTASNDNYLGDRSINDADINNELKQSSSIRTVFWNILSIMPVQVKEIEPTLYISKFMMDCIDGFIVNLEECYQSMNIHRAYHIINEFFDKIVNEIYVKTIRQRVIAFPNLHENQEHFFVMRRILQLVSVIAPLFPFSAYHISRKAKLQWPAVLNPKFYQAILLHNEMIETRVKLVNKLKLNKLQSAQIYCQSLKDNFSAHDLELFFNVKSVTFSQPDIEDRACSLPLNNNNSITSDERLIIYFSEDSCIRCDHKSKQADHLCKICVEYLEEEISQPLHYFPASTPKLP